MATEFCPECHQPMSNTAYGVRMPIGKLRLFWYIEKHPGQHAPDLASHFERSERCIRSHIYQINWYFDRTDIRIRGGRWTGYYVDKGKKHAL
jgi:hypothetical protein